MMVDRYMTKVTKVHAYTELCHIIIRWIIQWPFNGPERKVIVVVERPPELYPLVNMKEKPLVNTE